MLLAVALTDTLAELDWMDRASCEPVTLQVHERQAHQERRVICYTMTVTMSDRVT